MTDKTTDRPYVRAAQLADIPDGELKLVELGGREVLLCHSGGEVFAVRNKCSHADEPLACGRMRRGWISCPAHGARFRLDTGAPMNPPATEPIETFAVRIVDGWIEVAI